jgi:hypothetical protein
MELAQRVRIDVQPSTVADGRDNTVLFFDPLHGTEGKDITWAIRSKEVENNVSLVAAMQDVRRLLTGQMRRVGLRGRVVMVGRDVTVILRSRLRFSGLSCRAPPPLSRTQARGTLDLPPPPTSRQPAGARSRLRRARSFLRAATTHPLSPMISTWKASSPRRAHAPGIDLHHPSLCPPVPLTFTTILLPALQTVSYLDLTAETMANDK